jgi:universal stress protein E
MKRFKNILVGVDLCSGERLVADSLPPPSAQAVERALWLAKLNGAKVTLAYSLDVVERTQQLIRESGESSTVLNQARRALTTIAENFQEQGVEASFEILLGKSWVELIRLVLRQSHDLVIVGTRNLAAVSRALLGSTGMKLLRKCPCPVWVTRPSDQPQLASVLVAHDLTHVGTRALQLGASLSELQQASLHVLHALEHPEYHDMPPSHTPAEAIAQRRAAAGCQIEEELRGFEFAHSPEIVLADGEPSAAILEYIHAHAIDLVVMGTIARSGLSGVIMGNTAERLLPSVPCSILAVKPDDFVSPVGP